MDDMHSGARDENPHIGAGRADDDNKDHDDADRKFFSTKQTSLSRQHFQEEIIGRSIQSWPYPRSDQPRSTFVDVLFVTAIDYAADND